MSFTRIKTPQGHFKTIQDTDLSNYILYFTAPRATGSRAAGRKPNLYLVVTLRPALPCPGPPLKAP